MTVNKYEEVKSLGQAYLAEYYRVKSHGKWGLLFKNTVLIDCQYDDINYGWTQPNAIYVILKKGNKAALALIDSGKTTILTNFQYDEIIIDIPNGYKIKANGKWGLMNKQGRVVAQANYDKIVQKFFNGKEYELFKGDIKEYYDFYNDVFLPYEVIENNHPYFIIKNYGKAGLVNSNGNWIIDSNYDKIVPVKDRVFAIQQNYSWGYVNLATNRQYPLIFSGRSSGNSYSNLTIDEWYPPAHCELVHLTNQKGSYIFDYNEGILYEAKRPLGGMYYSKGKIIRRL